MRVLGRFFELDGGHDVIGAGLVAESAEEIIGNGLACQFAGWPESPGDMVEAVEVFGFMLFDSLAVAAFSVVTRQTGFTESATRGKRAEFFTAVEGGIDFRADGACTDGTNLAAGTVGHAASVARSSELSACSHLASGDVGSGFANHSIGTKVPNGTRAVA